MPIQNQSIALLLEKAATKEILFPLEKLEHARYTVENNLSLYRLQAWLIFEGYPSPVLASSKLFKTPKMLSYNYWYAWKAGKQSAINKTTTFSQLLSTS